MFSTNTRVSAQPCAHDSSNPNIGLDCGPHPCVAPGVDRSGRLRCNGSSLYHLGNDPATSGSGGDATRLGDDDSRSSVPHRLSVFGELAKTRRVAHSATLEQSAVSPRAGSVLAASDWQPRLTPDLSGKPVTWLPGPASPRSEERRVGK